MANLVLELFSEEIPAKMQQKMAEKSEQILSQELKKINISKAKIKTYITPRRLTLTAQDIPKTITQEKQTTKGPKQDAPKQAIEGFLKKHELKDIKELKIKDKYYFYESKESKIQIDKILTNTLEEVINQIAKSWPKTMRWGSKQIRWVRPLKNILCLLDDKIIEIKYGHLNSNNKSYGHRFLSSNKALNIKDFDNYFETLEKNSVILDQNKRKELILEGLKKEAKKSNAILVDDEELLNEVTGLVEFPVIMKGAIEKQFLNLPKEVLITTLKNHQKYFCLKNKNNLLIGNFLFASNNKVKDEKTIISGNEKVLKARLSDAKYFYEEDIKVKLEDRIDLLEQIIFHKDIGSMAKKSLDNSILAKFLAFWIPETNLVEVEIAAKVMKTDLTTEMVKELPELQGIMGYYYAKYENINTNIASAIKDHYLPQGIKDKCPESSLAITLSLADKIDSLVSLTLIGQLPTGSKDPFALRRLSIGIIRIILQNNLNIPLNLVINKAITNHTKLLKNIKNHYPEINQKTANKEARNLILNFLIDRFKIILKDKNIPHDIINAIFDSGHEDDLLKIYNKSVFLMEAINTKKGKEILESYRRAYRISYKAEKEDKIAYHKKRPHILLLKTEEEKELYHAYKEIKSGLNTYLKTNSYEQAFEECHNFVKPINIFFDKVTVNDNDQNLKANRLKLLANLCKTVNNFANFSKIEK